VTSQPRDPRARRRTLAIEEPLSGRVRTVRAHRSPLRGFSSCLCDQMKISFKQSTCFEASRGPWEAWLPHGLDCTRDGPPCWVAEARFSSGGVSRRQSGCSLIRPSTASSTRLIRVLDDQPTGGPSEPSWAGLAVPPGRSTDGNSDYLGRATVSRCSTYRWCCPGCWSARFSWSAAGCFGSGGGTRGPRTARQRRPQGRCAGGAGALICERSIRQCERLASVLRRVMCDRVPPVDVRHGP